MRKIMIVDDEKPIVEGLRLIIYKELGQEFDVVATASSGREALVKFEEKLPEIVLIDVMMPGLSGLDTIREIRKTSSTTVFILITAYERFDIAKEAVSLHVQDYLLKPLQRDQVVKALKRAAEEVEGSLLSRKRNLELQEQEDDSREFARRSLCSAILSGEDMDLWVDRALRCLGIGESWVLPVVVHLGGDWGINYEILCQSLRYKTKAFAGPPAAGGLLVAFPVAQPALAPQTLEMLASVLAPLQGVSFSAGEAVPWRDAHKSWTAALLDRNQMKGEVLRPGEEVRVEDSLTESAQNGSPEALVLQLDRDLWSFIAADQVPAWGVVRWTGLLSLLYRRAVHLGLLPPGEGASLLDMEDLLEVKDPEKWGALVRSRLVPMAHRMKDLHRYSPAVSQVLDILKHRFAEPLSLDSVADQIGMSPGRLSRIFASETGQGFSDYLIEIRIGWARRLLSQPGASVKEVSRACGYPDQNYFARLFKRVTGLTPSSYSGATGQEAGE